MTAHDEMYAVKKEESSNALSSKHKRKPDEKPGSIPSLPLKVKR